jgi:23S rRNA pseudouridine2605 synthase
MKKKTDNFDKFYPAKKNAAIKEQFKQEKKKWKKERSEAIEIQKKRVRLPAEAPQPILIKKKITHEEMPLNKFIAHSGVCARREAALLVKDGKVKVNGTLVVEPGFKVTDKDEISVNGKQVYLAKNLVYILLNKPKDYLTTSSDPEGRKTVLELIKGATKERVFPIGRLDRNTTGVLILTNDGELTQKLSHPSNEIKKIYEVKLDKPLTKKDMESVAAGIELEDGFIRADVIAYADAKDKSVIGIEIHSGRNRIVRRIFEHLGYDVRNLDRVMFAGLTKKNVDRSKWRYLNEKEVRTLKYLNISVFKDNVKKQRISDNEEADKIVRKDMEKKNNRMAENDEADRIIQEDRNKKTNRFAGNDGNFDKEERVQKKTVSKSLLRADHKKAADSPAKKHRFTKPRKSDAAGSVRDAYHSRASAQGDSKISYGPKRSASGDKKNSYDVKRSAPGADKKSYGPKRSAQGDEKNSYAKRTSPGTERNAFAPKRSAPGSDRMNDKADKPFRKSNDDRKPGKAVKQVKKKTTNKFDDGD